jgi:sphingomyelin phosphodiesterase acid-like 3
MEDTLRGRVLSPFEVRRWLVCLAACLALIFFTPAPADACTRVSRHKFLLVSDIHFNPMADSSLVSELSAAPPTEWEAILTRTQPTSFSGYGSDTNWWLLFSALDQMRGRLRRPGFIMISGDLLAHDFPKAFQDSTHDSDREHYRAFVLKTVEFLGLEFRKRFGKTPVLVTVGNNDEDCGDYSVGAGGVFLSDTAELVRSMAHGDDKLLDDWKALGSYNIAHPTLHHVRIMSPNTVFFSSHYHASSFTEGCSTVPSTAPKDLFHWAESNLAKAKANHEKVWLMFHIPPGIDGYSTMMKYRSLAKEDHLHGEALCSAAIVPMWVPDWTTQFAICC